MLNPNTALTERENSAEKMNILHSLQEIWMIQTLKTPLQIALNVQPSQENRNKNHQSVTINFTFKSE